MSAAVSEPAARTVSPPAGPRVNIGKILLGLLIGVLVVITLYPLVWLLLSSIKAPDEFSLAPVYALPKGVYWQNYVDAWTVGNMSVYFRNSLLVTLPSIALIILLGVGASFAIEVMRWRFNNVVLLIFLAGIMVPAQIVLLPLFTIYYTVGLTNNLIGLILVYTAFGLPLTVFLMTGYMKSLPYEVLESAVIDGANIYQIFYRIVLPMIANSIITIALVQFFFIWNDLLLSLTFISNTELRTLQTGLLNFVGQYGARQWGPTFAAIALAVVPTLVVYLFLNNSVIKGLTSGAVKG